MDALVEKQLPFSVQRGETGTDVAQFGNNDLVFALLECLADGIHIHWLQEHGSDIERLEHKLNLVIFLLNNLMQPGQSRPAAQAVKLTTDSIAWRSDPAYSPGTPVVIEVYLDPMIPIPLRCLARIDDCDSDWCRARLLGLSDEAMSSWSRWVFRQHRQFIALTREQDKQAHS